MKIFVKTLKGTSFEIEVKPEDKVETVKGIIETTQGANVYPAALQMLIHQGKVLKDGTTLDENKIAENAFVVIMLSKNKVTQGEGSTTSSAPIVKNKVSQGEGSMTSSAPTVEAPISGDSHPTSAPVSTTPQPPAAVPAPATVLAPAPSPVPVTAANAASDVYGQAASNLVAGNNLEGTIQQIIDMGGGTWDRDTVVRALRAAFNNPERAVDYLYSGIPESAEAPAATGGTAVNAPAQPQEAVQAAPDLSSGPNADPLNLFPQGLPNMGPNAGGANTLEFLRNTPQFQALREMVQANPQILQPMLQELGKQNPQLVRLIQDHQADFLRLINEPIEGDESNVDGQLPGAVPQAVTVTPEEREAIERLEAMGFDRAIVLQVFFACSKNEELAANYLLDHIHEFEE